MATKAKMCDNDEIIKLSEEIDEFGEEIDEFGEDELSDDLSEDLDNLKLNVDELVTEGDITWINEIIKNKYDNSPFRIPLRNRKGIIVDYSLVDEKIFNKINNFNFSLSHGYCQGIIKQKNIKLHHYVLKKPDKGKVIDHRNRDRLDNRYENLKETSPSSNAQNASKKNNKKTSSKYIGVSYRKDLNKFRAQCQKINLGSFKKEIDAAIAYDKYTFKVFGKDAFNNGLVKYEDILNSDLNDLTVTREKRELPLNIKISHKKYLAKKSYNKIDYFGERREKLEDAIKDLQIITTKINYIILMEEFYYLKQPIKRNKEGIAIIIVKYPNSDKELEFLVDDDKWYELNKINWYYRAGYAQNSKVGSMHRYIKNAKINDIVDHKNKKTYDNRIDNINIVSSGYNNHNTSKLKNCSSKFYGVSYDKSRNKWRASINKDGIGYSLGRFDNEIDAAHAYNEKAKELYGEYANLNVFDD
jgi:hypothetical protein